ncbi:monovalent cation/H(+) antiporter subunit G [Thioalkalivibrio sp.]|uniref:monovalent cation/H(+) antiporter subunit G n=1 Tax=Thioalkalivibrio sp. TaxID=2093813 RepID=UPI0012D55374|nr:monovalent cation/H(+) antiporter subunit G [Thioalkalivibrio sp.]TVP76255.1 MAG: monovalent cation/H(+) antiporter subunit G [Thioalkalivibrio sp.]
MNTVQWIGGLLVFLGIPFFLLGTLGLLRFPDVYTRLHALAKADNVGLGLVCIGLGVQSGSVALLLKLILIWVLMLISSATVAGLIARTALARGLRPWGT